MPRAIITPGAYPPAIDCLGTDSALASACWSSPTPNATASSRGTELLRLGLARSLADSDAPEWARAEGGRTACPLRAGCASNAPACHARLRYR